MITIVPCHLPPLLALEALPDTMTVIGSVIAQARGIRIGQVDVQFDLLTACWRLLMALILVLFALIRDSIPLVIVTRELSKVEIEEALETLDTLTVEGMTDTSCTPCLLR